ncbi:cysteine peptidase family C39 domain-containing protein [Dickeya undicola]|uniref:cysteine peptidase family C39 domain-containing protein n=1 Tax=Dickeya undicola TaxID=1577887 RepID=UPI003F20C036
MMTFFLAFLLLFDQLVNCFVLTYVGMIKPVYQVEKYDCGLACVCTLASHYGYHLSLNQLRKKYPPGLSGLSFNLLKQIISEYGIESCCKRITTSNFQFLKGPVISHMKNSHYVVFLGVKENRYCYFDPAYGFCSTDSDAWQNLSSGVILLPLRRPVKAPLSIIKSFISTMYFNIPFSRYIIIDFFLIGSLLLLSSFMSEHLFMWLISYSYTTVYFFRSLISKLSARVRDINSTQIAITPYLMNYQRFILQCLEKKSEQAFFSMFIFCCAFFYLPFSVLFLFLCFLLITLCIFFDNIEVKDCYYIKKTYCKEFSAMIISQNILRKKITIKIYILFFLFFLIWLYSFSMSLKILLISSLIFFFLSRWAFSFYIYLKEFLFIFNAE